MCGLKSCWPLAAPQRGPRTTEPRARTYSPAADIRREGSAAVEGGGSCAVLIGHAQVVGGPVALWVVHDRRRVVRRQRAPVVVLEAGARLGPRVLVAEAQGVAQLVAHDVARRPGA